MVIALVEDALPGGNELGNVGVDFGVAGFRDLRGARATRPGHRSRRSLALNFAFIFSF